MISFSELSSSWQSVFAVLMLVICFSSVLCIITSIVFRRTKLKNICCVGVLIVEYVFFQLMYDVINSEFTKIDAAEISDRFSKIPVWLLLIVSLFLLVFNITEIFKISNWRESNLSPTSIKEGMDMLTTGLCFSADNGTVLLSNKKMEYLCFAITGKTLMDANFLWESVSVKDVRNDVDFIKLSENPLIMLSDNSVWSFRKEPLKTKLGDVFQLTAVDITKRYNTGLELDRQVAELALMNERLEEFNKLESRIIREEELIETKANIHDKLGRTLITTRRYIESESDMNEQELLYLWRYVVVLLRFENNPEPAEDSIWEMEHAAKLAGVKLVTNGKIPDSSTATKILKIAALESINNASRHAGATEVYLNSSKRSNGYVFTFENDGQKPSGEVVEGGGLTGIRRRVKSEHGEMKIYTNPKFMLSIYIPLKEGY